MDISIDVLDESSIDAACRMIDEYAESLDQKAHDGCELVGKVAVDAAKDRCSRYTGELADSIRVIDRGDEVLVVADGDGAAFHEFGTGICFGPRNATTAAAAADAGWQQGISGHGSKGWVYPDPLRGFQWTVGQPGTGFMGHGAEKARSALTSCFERAFEQ